MSEPLFMSSLQVLVTLDPCVRENQAIPVHGTNIQYTIANNSFDLLTLYHTCP